ncbi:U5 snRNP spliceosome subunit [Encephalitozoon hellem ATCC 50504]|uniref:U5 snRNP pre-mRNA splicing factor Prp8 n=1 Tax=Encephalitozoon hellem TaxID=27973 RepID=A0A9Q9C9J9_ENCHE|nr:U5 snRNP spliceosome subunit [Encephalitozoon hellem ATCC 50504]AFM98118.1 U5 snRNP spliceosome subunit [Encephalitozoon hellem ATCC 50504]UTX42962.1 U5 snRNP pre-mRNA splicing factor Prp8 [Encephalitozoon hellem]|eukprot:XP_003887099.1 U5 snRNP spliceosome subunit [Encephalitozoon hellem ATCC 50504]
MPPSVRKERMPPEHLRRIIKVSRDMHPSFMGAMRYMPYALHNLMKSMPMPWESVRYVDVLYHVSGLITFVTEKRRVDVERHRARWSYASKRFSEEAKRRGFVRILRYPVFDDDDPVVDYGSIMGLPIPAAIKDEKKEECPSVFEDMEERYMFNCKAFLISRHVGMQLEDGPYVVESSSGVCVMEREAGCERIAYPYLYNKSTRIQVLERAYLGLRGFLGGEAKENKAKLREKHPVDIPLLKGHCFQERLDGPRVRNLLRNYTRNIEKRGRRSPPSRILKELKNTRYFQRTEIDWVEAGLQLVYQGHRMLSEILRRKKLSYLILDWNFNLKPIRQLTTKERKKSRVGTSYHLTREMLKFVKHLVDIHVLFRQGNIDCYELMGNVDHVLNNVGVITGMYRYKYKLMKQIKQCKSWKRLSNYAGIEVWGEQWRTWCFMFRGHIPLLGRYISGLVTRISEGREYNPKPLSKQRSESGYDVALKRQIMEEVSPILHHGQIRRLLQHFGEAWRCWKANVPYHIVHEHIMELGAKRDMPRSLEKKGMEETFDGTPVDLERVRSTVDVIRRSEGNASISFSRGLVTFSDKFVSELETMGKEVGVKHQKQLFELQGIIDKYIDLKSEWYIGNATNMEKKNKKEEKKQLGKITRLYMKERMAEQMEYLRHPFLSPSEAVAIYRFSAEYFRSKGIGKITFPERNEERFLSIAVDRLKKNATPEESEFFDKALEDSASTIFRIKKSLLTQRSFKEVGVVLRRYGDGGVECYDVSYMERLVDAFLCAYLFYESDRLNMFPEFIKPGDEIDIKALMDFCEKVSSFKPSETERFILYEGRYERIMRLVDNNLLSKLLKLVLDATLADYIISRNNCRVFYKDMAYTNHIGFIEGFQLSAFVYKFYSFIIDLCVLGEDVFMDERSSIKMYFRHMNDIYILFNLRKEEEDALLEDYGAGSSGMEKIMEGQRNYFDDLSGGLDDEEDAPFFGNEERGRHKALERCIHAEVATRLLPSLGRIRFRGCNSFPRIRFSMAGIDVLISSDRIHERGSWRLDNGMYANLAVNEEGIGMFESNISHIVKTSGSATFLKVATRWNTQILAFVGYYRECIDDTKGLVERLRKAEGQIQNIVKKGINSKMPVRFPPVMFYAPKEMGGLGMLSVGGAKDFLEDLNDPSGEKDVPLPVIMDYIDRWDYELSESKRVWMEYGRNGKIEPEKGIPRMSTLLQRSKWLLYDRGFRLVSMFRRHWGKPDWFWFTDTKHDGKLWSMDRYGADCLKGLGGAEGILSHTLFGATYFRSFSKVFWEDMSVEGNKRLTNAQRMGLSQVPNRRFILWWSPTINRGNVYVGYQVQLDQTGILMHGKLPTLKVSFIQIFRNHLWKRIYESIVKDLCDVFKKHCDVKRLEVHGKKSYRFGSSCADILLSGDFYVYSAASISEEVDGSGVKCDGLWIDVQLRWGDYDKRDPHKYAKTRYAESLVDPQTRYPVPNGFVVVLDLCYNTWSSYGSLNGELKAVLSSSMEKIIAGNAMLHVLRERLRKALQLYTSDIETVNDSGDLFNSGILVDTSALLRKEKMLFVFDPHTGNLYFKSYHGEGKKIRQIRLLAAKDIFLMGEELNKRDVVVSESMVNAMENFVIDHPSISMKTCSSIPLFSNVARIKEVRMEKSVRSINLYEGWKETSRFTNFCRVLLVMHGIDVDEARVRDLGIDSVWPEVSDKEWIKKEIQLKDLIVDRYCRIHEIKPSSLSQNEVRDIVFGFQVSEGGEGDERVIDVEVKSKQSFKGHGNISFMGNEGWRKRYTRLDEMVRSGELSRWTSEMVMRGSYGSVDDSVDMGEVLRIPLNLVEEFIETIDPHTLVFGLVIEENPICFGLIPQFSSLSEVHSSLFIPDANVMGVVINGDDLAVVDTLFERYKIVSGIAILIGNKISVMRRNDCGWSEMGFVLSSDLGVFYAPEMWNYSFARPFYDDRLEYAWKIRTPHRFYDGVCRVGHFSGFWKERESREEPEEN